MTQTKLKVVYSSNVTIINSSKNLATFDHKAGYDLKPVICTFTFMTSDNFVNDLKSSACAELGFYKYEVKNEDISLITLIPQEGYSNEKLEQAICFLFNKYGL